MTHVVLLGDSILDNAAYVARREATIDHLRRAAPPDWQSTYANAVEPSSQGGDKIARAVVRAVQEHDWTSGRSVVLAAG